VRFVESFFVISLYGPFSFARRAKNKKQEMKKKTHEKKTFFKKKKKKKQASARVAPLIPARPT
jgi:hypothetical protein